MCEWEDWALEIHYRGRRLAHHEILERAAKAAAPKARKPVTPPAPSGNHPWRKRYQDMQPRPAQ